MKKSKKLGRMYKDEQDKELQKAYEEEVLLAALVKKMQTKKLTVLIGILADLGKTNIQKEKKI